MRIKRFIASDMRTALRMVRDEQGPDAVILSNRPCAEGVEVVSATDYDEALVHQALRAAAPAIAATPAAAPTPAAVAAVAAEPTPAPASVPAFAATNPAPSVRETLATRARAVFKLGDAPRAPSAEPTLAELTADTTPAAAAVASAEPTRFDAMMAALGAVPASVADAEPANDVVTLSHAARAQAEAAHAAPPSPPASPRQHPEPDAPVAAAAAQVPSDPQAPAQAPAPAPLPAPKIELSLEPLPEPREEATRDTAPAERHLHAVPRWDADPAVAAMREELATMRQLIEREMGQFAVERLKGSPARAAAFDILLGYGCDDSLAQTLAAKIDPTLDPARVHAPMLAELARMLTISREEPIDDVGGNNNVIALVGPTGAGKTTTTAKIAARFAARHRARDVALVTTDFERVGACEQLHAHGRRLGITVCEAQGPEALQQTLAQLQDYPLVVVDTAGYGARDRALLGQITWLRATRNLRSLLVLPANGHPHDMNEVVRRYRIASPEGVVLTKLDETGRLGAALSVVIRNGLSLAYTSAGQQVSTDLAAANASSLVLLLEKLRRAADNPLATEDRHAVA
ncbi:flagellar biosynthesis protein FlhF [Lysobacter sp. F60174L2]|uniref:flagellar biosynthesis protein FlhF n=1 Tax=Lysobacter sp. F60174L2 TaxID=3459295 RepID=UPI00403DA931